MFSDDNGVEDVLAPKQTAVPGCKRGASSACEADCSAATVELPGKQKSMDPLETLFLTKKHKKGADLQKIAEQQLDIAQKQVGQARR